MHGHTRRKTLSHIKLLRQFLSEEGEFSEIQNIPPMELDNYLCKFVISVRQKNGNEYEPSYLRGMFGSFERYLRRHRYSVSLIKGHAFSRSKEVLKCKQKNLKKQRKGNLPNRADAVSDSFSFWKMKLSISSLGIVLNLSDFCGVLLNISLKSASIVFVSKSSSKVELDN
jgi:hypothetical protein